MSIIGTTVFPWLRRRRRPRVPQVATTLGVSAPSTTIADGDTVQLHAVVRAANGHAIYGAAVTWGSDDHAVATVDSTGLVTGVAGGLVTITATSGVASDTLAIEVDMLRSATVTLTDAQIKALPTTPITLVAAPGAGIIALPMLVTYGGTIGTGYGNFNIDAHLECAWQGFGVAAAPVVNDSGSGATSLSQLLDGGVASSLDFAGTVMYTNANIGLITSGAYDASALANLPLDLRINNWGDGALTGGAGGNSLKVTVYYVLVPV